MHIAIRRSGLRDRLARRLPRSGPDTRLIDQAASTSLHDEASQLAYAVVNLTPMVLEYTRDGGSGSLLQSFGGGRGPAPEIVIGVGDTVQVTIFEAGHGGLFIPADAGSRPQA